MKINNQPDRSKSIVKSAVNLYEEDKKVDNREQIWCDRTNKSELTQRETNVMRTFYWAAFFDLKYYIRKMILDYKWSPFIKSF